MKKTMLVEQVNANGEVVKDYDSNLQGIKKIYELLVKEYGKTNLIFEKSNKFLMINYKNELFTFYIKKVTYSGNPHPIHEKRIQVSLNMKEKQDYISNKLIIIGMYNYENNIIFILPKLYKKIEDRCWKNSSIAYIHTIDLIKCTINGKFKKTDTFKNDIYLFKQFSELLDFLITNNYKETNKPLLILDNFVKQKLNTNQVWYGKSCYEEMINNNFKDKYQPEWAGFYLEFIFQKYLLSNNIPKTVFKYLNETFNSQIFDLWILNSYYGDLKAHSLTSGSILGNDKTIVEKAVMEHGKLWYLVLEHSTILDKDHEYEVTKFWNNKLKKFDDLYSYGNKMKNRLLLSKFLVLEINNKNLKYLSDFNQGINSNNSKRNPKIKIDSRNWDNFVIYRRILDAK